MESLKIKINSGNIPITIKQYDYKLDQGKKEDVLYIYDSKDEIDTTVEIIVDGFLYIYYYMESFGTGLQDLTLYYIECSNTLLIGGKRKSCSINIAEKIVENEFEHCLFWDFDMLHDGYVVETGELDCLLRDKNGVILSKAPVDPPWECFYEDDGIRFESILFGEQFLKFP